MREPRERRRSRSNGNTSSRSSSSVSGSFDFDSLFDGDNSDSTSSLDSIFRRKTNNPFDTSSNISRAIEESELEEKARTDTNVIYKTGYSIHMLTPYILIYVLLSFGFIIIDRYFFNIVEFLSQDIRYKLPAYGIMILFFIVLTYLFIRKSFEYINFEMYMTKYKIAYGWKFLKSKNEITLFSIQEFLNKKGILGALFNYGNLLFFSNTRRRYSFDKIHGAQYIYEIIQELQYGESRGTLNQNATIHNILSGGKGNDENASEETNPESVDFNNLSSLGFTEEELKEFGMLPVTPKEKSSSKEEDEEDDDSPEPDTVPADSQQVVNNTPVESTGKRLSLAERRQARTRANTRPHSNDRSQERGSHSLQQNHHNREESRSNPRRRA